MSKYTMHEDSGHGWLAVPMTELVSLGIEKTISHYSYERGDIVYLEEDCDMSRFIQAKLAGQTHNAICEWFEKNVSTSYKNDSPIRRYPSYIA